MAMQRSDDALMRWICWCRCASSCHSLTLTLDGGLIASGHFDGSLRFWDMRSGRLAREVKQLHDHQICSVAAGLLGGEENSRDHTLWG